VSPAREAPRLVSVVIPVLNAERWIADQLRALAAQTYDGPWEVVVVDNGCSDASVPIALSFREALPELRVARAHGRRSLNHARNAGAAAARGELLAFCDADDVVDPGWLEALVAAARGADIVGGTFDLESLNPPLQQAWRPDDPLTELPVEHGFLPYVAGGNCAIWTDVARELGWDEEFDFGSSETEFCWRAQLASHTMAFAPGAVVQLRYRRSLGELARQYYSYGHSAPRLYRRFAGEGMTRDNRQALRWWRWLAGHARFLTHSPERRGNWIRIAAFRLGRIGGSIRARTLFL
jgi:glycosyltransferase involved in cell wall biosynthesis